MAFEGLSEKLARAFKNLRQHGHLTEADVTVDGVNNDNED